MQFRRLAIWVLIPLVMFSAIPVGAAPIDCKGDGYEIQESICSQPKLLAEDKAISDRILQLEKNCVGSQEVLDEGQKRWEIERWDCRNEEGALDKPGVLSSCLTKRMDERLRHLDDVGLNCDLRRLDGTYKFVEVDYIVRYSKLYLNRSVSVVGWLDLLGCGTSDRTSTIGDVVGNEGKHSRFRVKFNSLSESQRNFLCTDHPGSQWSGTIKHDNQGDYLFLTDVLGS